MFSKASPEPIYLPGGERHMFRRVFGSKFTISSAEESPGIQITDIILWLYKQFQNGRPFSPMCAGLIIQVFRKGTQVDLSFESVSRDLHNYFRMLDAVPITEKQVQKARELLELSERRRQQNMLEYAKQKLSAAPN